MMNLKRHLFVMSLLVLMLANLAFALDSNKDMILDDNDSDSPSFVVRDASEETAKLQKLDGARAKLQSTEGAILLQPSGNTTNYLSVETLSSNPTLWFWNALTNHAGIRLNDTSGKLEYRDKDSVAWSAMDDPTDW